MAVRRVDAVGFKTCAKCTGTKPVSEFHPANGANASLDGRQAYCKPCANAATPSTRDRKLRSKYGIGIAEYDAMLVAQQGRCRICGTTNPKTKRGEFFAVDHCHTTGRVRGLLCVPCNLLIGYAKEDPEILRSAIAYLNDDNTFDAAGMRALRTSPTPQENDIEAHPRRPARQ